MRKTIDLQKNYVKNTILRVVTTTRFSGTAKELPC